MSVTGEDSRRQHIFRFFKDRGMRTEREPDQSSEASSEESTDPFSQDSNPQLVGVRWDDEMAADDRKRVAAAKQFLEDMRGLRGKSDEEVRRWFMSRGEEYLRREFAWTEMGNRRVL